MCGIAAILRCDGPPIPEAWLDRLDRSIAGRGPDGHGRFRDRATVTVEGRTHHVDVALVHRRLSILDHAGGAQPMVSPRGRDEREDLVAVVFNGCLYNHRALRRELVEHGHRFESDHSDTEVLIHGWRQWGRELPTRLEGMYAVAIWDRRLATLVLARDLFGEKPLAVARRLAPDGDADGGVDGGTDGVVVAACSSRAGLAALAPAGLELDVAAPSSDRVAGFLRRGWGWDRGTGPGGDAPERAGIRVVRPGSIELHHPIRPVDRDLATMATTPSSPLDVNLAETLVDRAVASRLEADVPLGCFLSGGVDSSLVAALARRHLPDLRTFSVRMPDPALDETVHAEAAARHLGTTHRTLDVDPRPVEDLSHLVELLGCPFGDSSILPTLWVSRAAREHVTVALSGDGGDELFVGYERYMAAPMLERLAPALRRLPASLHATGAARGPRRRLARLGDMARDLPTLGIAAMESIFTVAQLRALVPGWAPGRAAIDPAERGLRSAAARLRLQDVRGYLPGDLLTKVDTASMAVALEVRAPLLDRDLARAALTAPWRDLTRGGRRKGLLRAVARRHLPASIVDRRKQGFAVPIDRWFREDHAGLGSLLGDALGGSDPFPGLPVDPRPARQLRDEHLDRRRDHGHRLFCLLTLAMWAQAGGSARGD